MKEGYVNDKKHTGWMVDMEQTKGWRVGSRKNELGGGMVGKSERLETAEGRPLVELCDSLVSEATNVKKVQPWSQHFSRTYATRGGCSKSVKIVRFNFALLAPVSTTH